jgi:hypothetical protein
MLELFAPAKSLPSAMAMMVLTTDLLYAIEPVIVNFVDFVGPVFTFALGGVLLIVTGYFFRTTTRDLSLMRNNEEANAIKSNFFIVFAAGLILGLITTMLKNFPALALLFKDSSAPMFVSITLAIAAFAAWPLSKIVDKVGVGKSLIYGLLGSFVLLFPIVFVQNIFLIKALTILSAPFFSLASVAAFPYALNKLAAKDVTLGTGIFFGSAEIAEGLLNILN